MEEEINFKTEKIINMEPKVLLEKLKYYFHHPTFKSDTQKNAILTILKRKCITILLLYSYCSN